MRDIRYFPFLAFSSTKNTYISVFRDSDLSKMQKDKIKMLSRYDIILSDSRIGN
jgi:hypothetical protein